ncbi:DUF2599 domain-containing protein [Isoptericola sp. 4D.3]|uniref:DUF2599 domain-containing protein n=1 Tax=Isoptericola peretonis TaxID=2918523 RepID=A0ABT0J0V2_9MICO|nr:DUF2599 domain-containing protein [Isoptericola sp. 4D.3]
MLPHRPTQRPAGALVALSVALAVGSCTPSGPAPTGPTPTSPAPGPSATDAPAGDARTEVSAGDVTLEVMLPGATARDGQVRVSADADTATATITLAATTLDADHVAGVPEIALTSPGTFEPNLDGSVTVIADDGTTAGGLTAPRGARLVAVGRRVLEARAAEGTSDADGTGDAEDADVATTLGTDAVEGALWGEREGGRSLAVTPTGWTRSAGQAGVALAWAELVAADPGVGTPTMRAQLECHAIGAPDKATWNLEPWRPDVGLVATMAARCNPTS